MFNFLRQLVFPITLFYHISACATEHITWLWDGDVAPAQTQHVALLTEHLWLTGERLLHRPRSVMPNLPTSTLVTPLVHIEFDIKHPPPSPDRFHDEILQSVVKAATRSTSGWVQLDYEARPSHRVFYQQLVRDIKNALPAQLKLSVTALAWWCNSPNWLDDLAADEIVPMFFRMRTPPASLHPRCQQQAIGLAIQEPVKDLPSYSKVYWFNYSRWKGSSAWPPN